MTRDQIAAALAGVTGLDVSAFVPDVVAPFAAWPRWAGAEPVETLSCLTLSDRWQAFVALPSGTRPEAAGTADGLAGQVATALHAAGLPCELIEPVDIQLAPGSTDTLPGLRFTLSS